MQTGRLSVLFVSALLEQRAQHPRILFVDFHTLGQQVGRRLVISGIGNLEGRDMFNSKADVIVCDGFTGNVMLKLAESFYSLIRKRNIHDPYFDRFDFENYGGTPVLGINSTVIIAHGISNAKAIKNMILLTREVVEAGLNEKISKALAENTMSEQLPK